MNNIFKSGLIHNVSKLRFPSGEISSSLAGTQFVRWRKGRWLPVAKSKQFWIPKRAPEMPEEDEELKRLYNSYHTAMRSVREHLRRQYLKTSETSSLAAQQAAEEEEEHRILMEFNNQENARVAALREKRVQEELEAEIAYTISSKEKLEKQELEEKEKALHIIAEAQELVKTFITREDLEKAIEAAIENPKNYNFAIDSSGNKYFGQDSVQGQEEKESVG